MGGYNTPDTVVKQALKVGHEIIQFLVSDAYFVHYCAAACLLSFLAAVFFAGVCK